MFRVVALLCAVLVLSACAFDAVYQPSAFGGEGYSDRALGAPGSFRVAYRAASPTVARRGALIRAAEIAERQGAESFVVVRRRLERIGWRISEEDILTRFEPLGQFPGDSADEEREMDAVSIMDIALVRDGDAPEGDLYRTQDVLSGKARTFGATR